MPNKTVIEWTDYTANPIYAVNRITGKRGWHCTRVSPGCEHCYAETLNRRFGTGLQFTAQNNRRVEFRLNPVEIERMLCIKGPARVFVGDMLDMFHPDVPFELVLPLLGMAALRPDLTIQWLTKRPERMREFFRFANMAEADASAITLFDRHPKAWPYVTYPIAPSRCLPNLWLGTSVEDQRRCERIPHLLDTPAAVHFVSYEPALEAVDFTPWLRPAGGAGYAGCTSDGCWPTGQYIDWIIVGGESGPAARPCDVAWPRNTVRQCIRTQTPCFVKQFGSCPVSSGCEGSVGTIRLHLRHRKGGDMAEWPDDLRVRQFPAQALAQISQCQGAHA